MSLGRGVLGYSEAFRLATPLRTGTVRGPVVAVSRRPRAFLLRKDMILASGAILFATVIALVGQRLHLFQLPPKESSSVQKTAPIEARSN